MKKILLIEDNVEISNSIKQYLELDDFRVTQFFRGDDGLDSALLGKYDLILQDIMLPGIDGFASARQITRKTNIPVIMITAKESIDDKLKGFDTGVVDYIVKPFDLRELQARIDTVFYRAWNTSNFTIWNITIDLQGRNFTKSWEAVKLTQKEFLIVEQLLQNRWMAVSRTDIIENLWWWDELFQWDGKLDVYISNLRKKFDKSLIETIKWFGYKII